MSIAEKLQIIAENEQKVYDAGAQSEYDRFWDSFQQKGDRRNYPSGFAGSCWTDTTYNPKYDIIITNMAMSAFNSNSQITSTKVPIVIDTSNGNGMNSMFLGCTRLQTIDSLKITKLVTNFTNAFSGCTNLKNVNITDDSEIMNTISFKDSPLSHDSIVKIINVLSDSVTGKTLTLKETAVNNAFHIDDQFTIVNTEIIQETGELIDDHYCHNIPCVLSLGQEYTITVISQGEEPKEYKEKFLFNGEYEMESVSITDWEVKIFTDHILVSHYVDTIPGAKIQVILEDEWNALVASKPNWTFSLV